jgi:hypothetical protein
MPTWRSRNGRFLAYGFGVGPQTGVELYYLRLWRVSVCWAGGWPRVSWRRRGSLMFRMVR